MAYSPMVESVRETYDNCCLTETYSEPNCRIDISGLENRELTAVHGDFNQRCTNHQVATRLCDRLIFGRLNDEFVCAAELKGGRNPEVPKAIRQIQGGLDLARSILGNRVIERWYPLLFFRGKVKGNDRRVLQTRRVSYGGKKKLVERVDCGASLLNYLNRQ